MRSIESTIGESGVATLVLNRPESLNALNFDLVDTLRADLLKFAASNEVRAIVITGAGRAFSAGGDLTSLAPVPQADGHVDMGRQVSDAMRDHFAPLMNTLMSFPKPIVVAINGIAAGGAAGIALCGDVILAGRAGKIKFVQTPQLGIIADLGASWLLQRSIGRQGALAAMLLGEAIGAEHAQRLGLVWEVVDDDQLAARAQVVARSLAAVPAAAVRATRQLVDTAAASTFAEMMELERLQLRDLAAAPELLARINFFLKK